MSVLFERLARVSLDTPLPGQKFNRQVVEKLRTQFKVVKTLKKQPNTCEISISNLSEASRAILQQPRAIRVTLEAGYKNTIARIFSGDSRFVDQIQDQADWVTKIQCGDGERVYKYRRVSQSFSPGVRVSDVISTVANLMGLSVTGLAEVAQLSEQFTQGYSAYGKVAVELDNLLRGRSLEWSIQDGQLQILPVGGNLKNAAIFLSPDNGMIGSPEHGNPEKDVSVSPDQYVVTANQVRGPQILKVKSLLQPGFVPGRKIQIQSRGTNGIFRIQTVTHTGDTHGGDWYSDLECLPAH